MTLAGSLHIIPSLKYSSAAAVATSTKQLFATALLEATIASGTGANQMDLIWEDTRALAASTGEDLDLAGGLTDAFGTTLTFVKVKLIWISAASANGSTISVGGASATQFVNWVANASDIVKVRPGGCMLLYAPDATGYGVTAATGDLFKILNDDGAAGATYSIIIGGTSA